MRTEASVPPADRYLSLAEKLTERRFIQEKEAVIAWCSDNAARLDTSNVAALELLRTLELTSNLIAVVVVGCYADIPQVRIYTAAFHRQDGLEVQETLAELRLGIFWSRIATEGLEHGHHQVAVLEFPKGVPPLLQRLPLCTGTQLQSVPDFGLCDIENWETIHAARANAQPAYMDFPGTQGS
jgi:hypothetical protein